MPLLVYRPRNYDQTHEREQFRNLCVLLKERYYSSSNENCIFIGNYNIGDVELDGIVIKDDGIILVEFKDYGGDITATENGDWYSVADGIKSVIRGGSGQKNPYLQAKINRNASKPVLVESGAFTAKQLEKVSSLIVFHKPANINNQISSRIKWLRICDERDFIDELDLIVTPDCDLQWSDYRRIIDRLALDPDWLCVRYSNVDVFKDENATIEDKHNQDMPVVLPETTPKTTVEIESKPVEELHLEATSSIHEEKVQPDFVSYIERVFSALGITGRFVVIDLKNNAVPSWVNETQLTNEFLVATACVAFKDKLKRFLFKPVYEREGILYWFDGEPLNESFNPRHTSVVDDLTQKGGDGVIANPVQMKSSTRLPSWLDKLVYEELGARWESDCHKFESNLDSSKDDNLIYLGTYFPRSYADAFCIFDNLFSNNAYRKSMGQQEEINILSIGCGTGGDTIGLLTCLVKFLSHLKSINVFVIDGNKYALDLLKIVFDRFCDVSKVNARLHIRDEIVSDFSKIDLSHAGENEYDFILSSKMISEIISARSGSFDNAYYGFGKRFLPLLSSSGVCLILDVTTKVSHSHLFYPQLMSEQLNALLREEPAFKALVPICCARFGDQCHDRNCFQQKEFSISHSHKNGDKCRVSYRLIARCEMTSFLKYQISEWRSLKRTSALLPATLTRKLIRMLYRTFLRLIFSTIDHLIFYNMPKRSFFVKDSELDDWQIRVINKRTDNSFIVKGCAGSGKSILALWKAKQIQEKGMGTYLYVVYTKALRQYMEDGIMTVGLNDKNVKNFDSCFSWTKTETGFVRGGWKVGYFDYIIVDEAQDFSKEDIEVFRKFARKALLLYGDSAQQLYKFNPEKTPLSIEDIYNMTRFPMEQLVFNHRLPKKIARVAQYINSENDELEERCTTEGMDKPKILRFPTKDAELDAIASIIKNKSLEDVGILFRLNEEVEYAYRYLSNKGLTVEAKYGRQMDLDFTSDNPKLMTYHSSKGLQFENVFIPDCEAEKEEERNPLYVAITRTYESLYIMHTGNLSSFFDPIPRSLYDTSLQSASTITL